MIQLSAIDLWYVTKELSVDFIDAKLDQIYQYDHQTLLLRFHKTGVGKREIHIHVPRALFETAKKPPVAKHMSFCSYLRKTIKGSYLTDVGLLGYSRVVYFTFGFKETSYTLFCEFYDKGNIILCSKNESGDFIIDLPAQMQKWSARLVQKGQPYDGAKTPFPYELSESEFSELRTDAKKEDIGISKFFATKFKIGGFYAKYLMNHLGLADTDSLDSLTYETTVSAIKSLFTKTGSDLQPTAYVKEEGNLKTATKICAFETNHSNLLIHKKTLNELLDAYYEQEESAEYEDAKTRAFDQKVKKLTRILDSQKKVATKLNTQMRENELLANTLQKHAYEADQIIREYRSKKSSDKIISENKKEKTIVVELE